MTEDACEAAERCLLGILDDASPHLPESVYLALVNLCAEVHRLREGA